MQNFSIVYEPLQKYVSYYKYMCLQCPPSARPLSEFLQCSIALRVSSVEFCVAEWLIRYDCNKTLNIKRCFMCIKKDKMVKKIFRYLLFKQKQSADLKNFDISYIKFTFCVGAFIRSFKLPLMILILPLN